VVISALTRDKGVFKTVRDYGRYSALTRAMKEGDKG
jgi:hypothetical protein